VCHGIESAACIVMAPSGYISSRWIMVHKTTSSIDCGRTLNNVGGVFITKVHRIGSQPSRSNSVSAFARKSVASPHERKVVTSASL
jgi:hypothetical protein